MTTELTASIIDGVLTVSGSATLEQRRSVKVEILPQNEAIVQEDTGGEFVGVPVSDDGTPITSAAFDELINAGVLFQSAFGTMLTSVVGTSFNDRIDVRENTAFLVAEGGDGNDRILVFGEGSGQLLGQRGNDYITAVGASCILSGGAGIDRLEGGSGNDRLIGGRGNDTISGGGNEVTGVDRAVYSGARVDYLIELVDEVHVITDLRDGSPDGRDSVSSVEVLKFSDGRVLIEDALGGNGMASPSVAEFWI